MASTPIADISKAPVAAEVSARYNLVSNTFAQKHISDPVNGHVVEIGDSKQPEFYAQIKIMRWGNEVNFTARFIDLDDTPATIETTGNKIKYKKAAYEAHFYDLGFDKDGGFEHEIILNEKPATNKLQWTIQSKGLKFGFQGELTPEEIAEGVGRAPEYIDSIVAYHDTKAHNFIGGNNYEVGKFFHLKRITLLDAKGNADYGTQEFAAGIWTVTLPQAFLDSAVYPIVVDPTFGYASVPVSTFAVTNVRANIEASTQYTASVGDTITGYSLYGITSAGTTGFDVSAYTFNGTNPASQLAAGVTVPLSTTAGWGTSGAISQTPTGGTTLVLAFGNDGANTETAYFDSIAGNNTDIDNSTGALPATFTHASYQARVWGLYATYTTGGGTGVTVNLSGVSGTGDIGALFATGAALVHLNGLSGTGEVGSLSIAGAAHITLTGLSGTGEVGALTVSTGNGITVNLEGISGTGEVGTLSAIGGAHFTLAHISAIGEVGSFIAKGGAIVNLSGLQGDGQVGSLLAKIQTTINLAGLSANGSVGILDITGGAAVILTGQMATGEVGSLTIETGITEISIPGYNIFAIEHEDRRYLVLAEDRKSTIH